MNKILIPLILLILISCGNNNKNNEKSTSNELLTFPTNHTYPSPNGRGTHVRFGGVLHVSAGRVNAGRKRKRVRVASILLKVSPTLRRCRKLNCDKLSLLLGRLTPK